MLSVVKLGFIMLNVGFLLLCWKSLCWMSLCWVLLCWISLCWVLVFYCYAECHYVECRGPSPNATECWHLSTTIQSRDWLMTNDILKCHDNKVLNATNVTIEWLQKNIYNLEDRQRKGQGCEWPFCQGRIFIFFLQELKKQLN